MSSPVSLSTFEVDWLAIDREVSQNGLSIVRPQNGFLSVCEAAREEYLRAFASAPVQPPRTGFIRDRSRNMRPRLSFPTPRW